MKIYQYLGIIVFIIFLMLLFIYLKYSRKKSILIACIICFLVTGALVSLDPSTDSAVDKNTINTNEKEEREKENTYDNSDNKKEEKNDTNNGKYLTKLQWADTKSFVFAVEIDDYDGDIVKSGKYNFITTGKTDKSHVAIVWDIYASKNLYQNINELNDSEYITSIGGNNNDSYSIDLEKGKYVYIKYNKTALKPSGMLTIDLIK